GSASTSCKAPLMLSFICIGPASTDGEIGPILARLARLDEGWHERARAEPETDVASIEPFERAVVEFATVRTRASSASLQAAALARGRAARLTERTLNAGVCRPASEDASNEKTTADRRSRPSFVRLFQGIGAAPGRATRRSDGGESERAPR